MSSILSSNLVQLVFVAEYAGLFPLCCCATRRQKNAPVSSQDAAVQHVERIQARVKRVECLALKHYEVGQSGMTLPELSLASSFPQRDR